MTRTKLLACTASLLAIALFGASCGGRTTLDDTTPGADSGTPEDGSMGVDVSTPMDSSVPPNDAISLPDSPIIVDSGPPPQIQCGTTTCDSETEVCCVTFSGMTLNEACTAPTACTGASLSCSSAADCPSNEVCCGQFTGMTIDSQCAPACTGGFQNPQLCATSAECPSGETCQSTMFGFKICRH